ncbi:MAG: hypothetical protein HY681_13610, partial [Chloroflexi bacterium]|nr:hypothetical protein [Chloroflexota bacterium]
GLAAFGDEGEDLMLALARRIVQEGEAEDESLEEVFARARRSEGEAEEWLVDRLTEPAVEPEPEPALVGAGAVEDPPAEERDAVTVSWQEFMELKPAQRRKRPQPTVASLSLFEWAMGVTAPVELETTKPSRERQAASTEIARQASLL